MRVMAGVRHFASETRRFSVWQKAVDALRRTCATHAPTVPLYEAAIRACAQERQWSVALEVLHEMCAAGCGGSVKACNMAMNACVKATRWQQALDVLQHMPAIEIQPTVVSFNTAISACDKGHQWPRALTLLEHMPRFTVMPTVVSYGAVLFALEKSGKWQQALLLLNQITRTHHISPNGRCFTAAIMACAKARQWQRALLVFKQAIAEDQVDTITVNSMLSACEKGHAWVQALELLQWAHTRHGVEVDVTTLNTALSACANAGQWCHALDVLYGMIGSSKKSLRPDVVTVSGAITACEKAHEWTRALALFDTLTTTATAQREASDNVPTSHSACRIVPNVVTYTTALAACGKGKQWQRVVDIFAEMQERGLELNAYAWCAALTACARSFY